MLLTLQEYLTSYIKEHAYLLLCEKYNVIYLNEIKGIQKLFVDMELARLIEKCMNDDNLISKYSYQWERMINHEFII